jgi:ABC-2 type transport system ATP-binding protein
MTLALEISDLVKEYKAWTPVVQGLNYSVEEGGFSAFLWANGAGKSTTLGIIGWLVNKTSWSVRVFGVDLDEHPEQVRSLIGFMPQEVNLAAFDKTYDILLDNAGYHGIARPQARARVDELLTTLWLMEQRDKQSRMLSGGMKRRLMLARALVHRPQLLILDEPTAWVDVEQREIIWQFVDHLRREEGMTVILTTHYLEEVERFAERVVMLKSGVKIHDTTIREMLDSLGEEVYRMEVVRKSEQKLDEHFVYLEKERAYLVTIDQKFSLMHALRVLEIQECQVSGIRPEKNRLESLFSHLW